MAVSIVIGTLGFVVAAFGPSIAALIESPALIKLTKELVAASALIPSAIVRQLFIEKRQTFKDFAFNFFTISSTMWNFMAKVIVTTFGKHKAETTAPVSVVDNKAETTGPVSIVENKNDATTVAVQPKNRSGIAARKSAIVKDFLDVNLLLEGVKIFINLVKAAIGHPRIPKIEVRLFSKWPRNKEPEKTKAIMPAEETPSTNKANENKTAPETTESKVPKVSLPKAKTH